MGLLWGIVRHIAETSELLEANVDMCVVVEEALLLHDHPAGAELKEASCEGRCADELARCALILFGNTSCHRELMYRCREAGLRTVISGAHGGSPVGHNK